MIYLILFLALILRLWSINQSLWLDEAVNIWNASQRSLLDYLTVYSMADFHPPGYFLIIWLWGQLFGFGEISIRLTSVLLGLGTIWLTYKIGQRLFSQRVGLIAGLLLAISPLHIYYSQEARMYSMAAFSVTLAYYFLIKFLKQDKAAVWGYAISIILVLYSDYVAYFSLLGHLIWLWPARKQLQQRSGSLIKVVLLVILGYLPWLPLFWQQLNQGQQTAAVITTWSSIVGSNSLKSLLLIPIKFLTGRVNIAGSSLLSVIIGSYSLFSAAIIVNSFKDKVARQIFFGWLVVPMVFIYGFSFVLPILSYFRLLFLMPAMVLLMAIGIARLSKLWAKVSLTIIILVSLVFSLWYLTNPQFQREDWRSSVKYLNSLNCQCLILFEGSEVPAPFKYYAQSTDLVAQATSIDYPYYSTDHLLDLSEMTEDYSTVYLYQYYVEIADPNRLVETKLLDLGYSLVDSKDFNGGLGLIYHYEK